MKRLPLAVTTYVDFSAQRTATNASLLKADTRCGVAMGSGAQPHTNACVKAGDSLLLLLIDNCRESVVGESSSRPAASVRPNCASDEEEPRLVDIIIMSVLLSSTVGSLLDDEDDDDDDDRTDWSIGVGVIRLPLRSASCCSRRKDKVPSKVVCKKPSSELALNDLATCRSMKLSIDAELAGLLHAITAIMYDRRSSVVTSSLTVGFFGVVERGDGDDLDPDDDDEEEAVNSEPEDDVVAANASDDEAEEEDDEEDEDDACKS